MDGNVFAASSLDPYTRLLVGPPDAGAQGVKACRADGRARARARTHAPDRPSAAGVLHTRPAGARGSPAGAGHAGLRAHVQARMFARARARAHLPRFCASPAAHLHVRHRDQMRLRR